MSFLQRILSRLRGGPRGLSRGRRGQSAEEILESFQEVLGFRFNRPELLRQALTHRSAVSGDSENDGWAESNERLEFLGDSVLGLVVNEHLFREFPEYREGTLTQMKSLLVSRAVLSVKAREMGVGEYLFMSLGEEESGGRDRSSILADAFEAIVGAIYLDSGMEAARRFIESRLMTDARKILNDRKNINYKSMLQEHIQSEMKIHPRYLVTAEDGPDHEKMFTVAVMVGKRTVGRGRGKNKKQAQQHAARDALQALGLLPRDSTSAATDPEDGPRGRRRGPSRSRHRRRMRSSRQS